MNILLYKYIYFYVNVFTCPSREKVEVEVQQLKQREAQT